MKRMDQVRDVIGKRHYSMHADGVYVERAGRFILFHGKRHPKDMEEQEISQYISHPASERSAAASTRIQALKAISFLYRNVP